MRMLTALVVLVGCGAPEPEDTGPVGSCSDLGTSPLSSLPVDAWPAGLSDQTDDYEALPGVYTAEACGGGTVSVKISDLPPLEEVGVVTTTVDAALPCGCTIDPEIDESDNQLGAYAYVDGAKGYVGHINVSDAILDPAVEGRSLDMQWAFLPSTAPTALRGCGVLSLEPSDDFAGSVDAVTLTLRRSASGALDGVIEALGDAPTSCALTDFTWLGPPDQ